MLQSPRTLPRKPLHLPCLLISGGAPRLLRETVSNHVSRYNTVSDTWESVSSIPDERHHHAGMLFI